MALGHANGWAGIARFGGIGDNLIAASVAYALKHKGLKVEMITSDPAWVVFENNPNIDKLSVKTKSEVPSDMLGWQKWFKGRSDEFDVFAHLSHSCETSLAFFPAQTTFWWPSHMRRKIAAHNYLEFVHDIAGAPYEFGPLFYSSDEEKEKAQETRKAIGGGSIIGWAISGTRLDKIYPYTPMVIGRLIKEFGVQVVLLGAPGKNFTDAKAIAEHVARQNGSDAGLHVAITSDEANPNWPIRRSLSFAQACDLVITPDTGVAWAVAFEKLPKIVLLSHASEQNITQHWINTVTLHADPKRVDCWPCHQLHDEQSTCRANKENNGAACISDISVEDIMSTVSKLLKESKNG